MSNFNLNAKGSSYSTTARRFRRSGVRTLLVIVAARAVQSRGRDLGESSRKILLFWRVLLGTLPTSPGSLPGDSSAPPCDEVKPPSENQNVAVTGVDSPWLDRVRRGVSS